MYFVAAAGERLGVLAVDLGEPPQHRVPVGGELSRLGVDESVRKALIEGSPHCCERPSASEGAASNGLRGRGTR